MKTLRIKIEGTTPLMMNNPQTVSPFNEYAKEIKKYTSKRKRTDAETEEMYRLKFLAALYYRNNMYYLPSIHLWRSLIDAAKENKLGSKFKQSLQVIGDMKLVFPDRDKTPEQLYSLKQYVDIRDAGVQKSRITCVRPIFQEWATEAEVWFDENQINEQDVLKAIEASGMRYGLGTYRMLYGRFKAKVIN